MTITIAELAAEALRAHDGDVEEATASFVTALIKHGLVSELACEYLAHVAPWMSYEEEKEG